MLVAGLALGQVDQFQNIQALLKIGLAEIGQALLARGPVQQPDFEMILKRVDPLADQRAGHVQPLGRGAHGA